MIEYFLWASALIPISLFIWRYRVYRREQREQQRSYRGRHPVRYDFPDKVVAEKIPNKAFED